MDNWLLAELMAQEASRERQLYADRAQLERRVRPKPQAGFRRSLAAALVRLGVRLDPSAGERLATLDLAQVAHEGGRSS